MEHGICNSFEDFKERLGKVETSFRLLGPNEELSKICSNDDSENNCGDGSTILYYRNHEPKEETMILLGDGILRAFCEWEAYVVNIFEEAFHAVLDMHYCSCDNGSCNCTALKRLENAKPGFKRKVRKSLERLGEEENVEELKELLTTVKNPEERSLLNYRNSQLRVLKPRFKEDHNLDVIFQELFSTETVLSYKIIDRMGTICFDYRLDHNYKCSLEINDSETLCGILELYFGIRCLLAHGRPSQKILDGPLKSFPNSKNEKFRELSEAIQEAKTIVARLTQQTDQSQKQLQLEKFNKASTVPCITGMVNILETIDPNINEETRNIINKLSEMKDDWPDLNDANCVSSKYGFYSLYELSQRLRKCDTKPYLYVDILTLGNFCQFILKLSEELKTAIAGCLHKEYRLTNVWNYTESDTEYDTERSTEEDYFDGFHIFTEIVM